MRAGLNVFLQSAPPTLRASSVARSCGFAYRLCSVMNSSEHMYVDLRR